MAGAASDAPSITAPGPLSTAIARRTALLPSWETTRTSALRCRASSAIWTFWRSLATTHTIALARPTPAAFRVSSRLPATGTTAWVQVDTDESWAAVANCSRTTTRWPQRCSCSTIVTPMPSSPQTMTCPASSPRSVTCATRRCG